MRVLWDRGDSSVSEVIQTLPDRPKPAYNTVLTMFRILERKRYVQHRRVGRAFVFTALLDQTLARRRALQYLINRFFDGSAKLLALNLLNDKELSPDEIKRLTERIEEAP
jgi:BlaI family transcriptional regulator, penicillinase repressor